MPATRRTHVEVYVFRRVGRRIEHLCLRRTRRAKKLPGAWQPVTGKVELLERAIEAAVREVREETGLSPVRWWALETVITYFDPPSDTVRFLPLFAAEVMPGDEVVLSKEHDEFEWLDERAFGKRVLWEMQRRGLDAVRREVLDDPRLAVANDVTRLALRGAKQEKARAKPKPRARRAAER